jgi:hypothetical protein
MRQAVLPATSCNGLTATDTLGVYAWRCEQRDGAAVFVGDRLQPGITLRTLVDASGFVPNRLEVRAGSRIVATSDDRPWWPNPVVSTTPSTLDAEDTVYVVPASLAGMLAITAPGVALATLDGATIQQVEISAPYAYVDVDAAANGTAAIAIKNTSFATVGGLVTGGVPAVGLSTTTACEIRGMRVLNNGGGNGIDIQGSRYASVFHAAIQSASFGVYVLDSPDLRLHDVESANSSSSGVELFGASPRAVMTDIVAANNGFESIQVNDTSDDVILVGALAAYTFDEGVLFNGVDRATISHVTAVGNEQFGVSTYLGANYASVSQINAFNNGYYGLFVRGSVWGVYGQIAVTNNAFQGARIYQNADFNTFTYAFLGGTGDTCLVDGGGVDNNTVVSDLAGVVCGGDDPALKFHAVAGLTQATFLGDLVVDDSTNAHAATLAQMQSLDASQITDWLAFDTPYRIWGTGTAADILDGTNRLDCRPGEQCRAWDVSLLPGNPFANTSGTGSTQNEPFVAGQACPSAVDGDYTFTNLRGTEVAGDGIGDDDGVCEPLERCDGQAVFVVNARELIEDGAGNDNGLCESGEACVYSPNFGYYQGQGDPLAAGPCVFHDGIGAFAVSGVTMYAYPTP